MDGNGIAVVVFLFLIFSGVSNASLLWKLRKLADVVPNNGSTATATASIPTVSPSPNPGTVDKKSDPEVDGSGKAGSDSSKLDPNVSNGTGSTSPLAQKPEAASEKKDLISPPPQNLTDTGKNLDLSDKDTGKSKGSKEEEEKNKKGEEIDGGQSSDSDNNGDAEKNKETKEGEEEKKKSDSEDKNELQDKQTKEGQGKKNDIQPNSGETCDSEQRCKDENSLVACIKHFERSKELVVIVQNEGEETLEVNLMVSTSIEYHFKLPKHESNSINISLASIQSDKLIVSAGYGNCSLHMDSIVSRANFFFLLPSYDELVTPINGAYFLIATVVIFVATCACCKCRNSRRRQLDAIPYQELEMGRPESMSTTVVETAEGWDEGWDDDWDEEHAVKSPAARHLGNISANGLTVRSSNKDGWEDNWDD